VGNKKVLIFEDQLVASIALEAMLSSNGYESLGVYSSADKAVELFRENPPDVILMDIMLKGIATGIEAAVALRDVTDVPILFVSALNNGETIEQIRGIKNSDLQVKPYDEGSLIRQIATLIEST